jgi:hypothetical protein
VLVLRLPCDMTEMEIALMAVMSSKQLFEKKLKFQPAVFALPDLTLFLS